MKRKKIIGTISTFLVIAVLVTILFYPSTPTQRLAIDKYATDESVSFISNTINDFSFEIYNQLSLENDGNIFLSPYSIFVALAMTYEGANGKTAEEMNKVLKFPQNNETFLCSFGRIYNLLNQKKEYTLNTANALWTQKDYTFLNEYLHFINNYYMGKATDVDFKNAEKTAQIINNWVEENTGGKIKEFLSSDDIDPLTKLILTNAIYFKGDWKYQFNPENTVNDDFEISQENTISVPMMSLSNPDITFNYYESDDVQILELPYKGDKLSMIIYLPKEHNISNIENMFDNENFSSWNDLLFESNIQITMPKFKMETEYRLKQNLMNMGMIDPFSMNADFSGMNGNKDLYIEKVIHKGFIELNEKGTEAAGASSVHMTLKSAPGIFFNADHPFLYLILHKQTNTILFMGRVVNPE